MTAIREDLEDALIEHGGFSRDKTSKVPLSVSPLVSDDLEVEVMDYTIKLYGANARVDIQVALRYSPEVTQKVIANGLFERSGFDVYTSKAEELGQPTDILMAPTITISTHEKILLVVKKILNLASSSSAMIR